MLKLFDLPIPKMPTLDVSRCSVSIIDHLTASKIIKENHYSKRCPPIQIPLGMYVDDVLAGVLTYGKGNNRNMQLLCGDEHKGSVLELTRLFVFDWAGRNSESWFIGQSFRLLNEYYPQFYILVSYADPNFEHVGYVYQATNWLYTGLAATNTTEFSVDGVRMPQRSVSAIYGHRRISELQERGLKIVPIPQKPKHRYVYFLGNRKQKKMLKYALRWPILPYPKGII